MLDDFNDLHLWSPQGVVTRLEESETWNLLHTWSFGRVAVIVDGAPVIFPVNFAVDRHFLVFRTATGTKLTALRANPKIAFEADQHSQTDAWSVLVTGTAEVLEQEKDTDHADRLPLLPWIPTAVFVYIRIVPETIQGRHIERTFHLSRLSSTT